MEYKGAMMTNSARKDVTTDARDVLEPKQRRKTQRHISTERSSAAKKNLDLKAQRDQALDATFGLLKGKGILPADALQFERELRDE